jgi:hypothetical protein
MKEKMKVKKKIKMCSISNVAECATLPNGTSIGNVGKFQRY